MNGVMVEFPGGHGRQDHHQSLAESERSLCESELAGPGCARPWPGRLFRSSREIFLVSRRSPWMFEKIFLPFLRDVSMSEVLQGSDFEIFNFRPRYLSLSRLEYKDPIVKYSTLEIENSEDRQLHEMLGKKKENEGVDPGPSASADSSP